MKAWPKVSEHMDLEVPTLRLETPITDAVKFLLQEKVTGAPVVDEQGRVLGMFTEFDGLRLLAEGGADNDRPVGSVRDYMTRDVVTVPPSMDIYYAAGLFLGNRFRRLPVVDNGILVGAITRFDILRAVAAGLD